MLTPHTLDRSDIFLEKKKSMNLSIVITSFMYCFSNFI